MRIGDVMSKKVTTVHLTTSLREAAEKMRAEDIGALPVVDSATDKIRGMLTDRDIVVRAVAMGRNLDRTSAAEVMTEKIRYVFEDEDIAKAAEHMQDRQIRRLVVLNRDKRLVGLVALSDLALKGQDEHLSANVVKAVSEPTEQHAMH
jgi:CBS domain-containing protein